MLWFLRLFPQFAALERSIASWQREEVLWKEGEAVLYAIRDRADAEIAMLRKQVADKDAEIARLNSALIEEAHKVADTMSVHAIGKRMFTKASDQPPAEVQPIQPQMPRRPFAREMQQQQAQNTRDALRKIWDEIN